MAQKEQSNTEKEKQAQAAFLQKNKEIHKETGHSLFSPSRMSIWNTCPYAFWLFDLDKQNNNYADRATKSEKVHQQLQDLFLRKIRPHDINKKADSMFEKVKIFYDNMSKFQKVLPEYYIASNDIPFFQGTIDLMLEFETVQEGEISKELLILDYKISETYKYEASKNMQLISYAALAIEQMSKPPKNINFMIIQPNSHSILREKNIKPEQYADAIHKIYAKIIECYNTKDPQAYLDDNCSNPFCPAKTMKN